MKTLFFHRQDPAAPTNGRAITNPSELRSALSSVRDQPPFFAELIGDNGFKLLLGLASTEGCVQFSSTNGSAPYFMAVAPDVVDSEAVMSFLIGDTETPVPARYRLPHETIVEIAEHFLQTGRRKAEVLWEEI